MSEQVKEPKRSKTVALFILFFFAISFCVFIFLFVKKPASIDFTDMTSEEVISAVKKLDKDILDVDISHNKKGGEALLITFLPNILINPLTESAIGMQRVAEKVMTQKGADHFEGIYFTVKIIVNESEQRGAKFFWSKNSLYGINWDTLTKNQFLNLTSRFEANQVFRSSVDEYCSEEENANQPFCKIATSH